MGGGIGLAYAVFPPDCGKVCLEDGIGVRTSERRRRRSHGQTG